MAIRQCGIFGKKMEVRKYRTARALIFLPPSSIFLPKLSTQTFYRFESLATSATLSLPVFLPYEKRR